MHLDFDVVVVGRGLVGMAAARALSLHGLKVASVGPVTKTATTSTTSTTQTAEDASDLRVYALSPGTKSLLEELKVWGALVPERLAAVSAMRVYSPANVEMMFAAQESNQDVLNYVVEHKNLAQALEKSLVFSQVTSFNESVLKLDTHALQSRRQFAERTFAELTLGSGLTLRAKLVVAADGADSPMREFAHILANRQTYSDHAVVANLQVEQAHEGIAYQWFSSEHGVIAFLPLANPHHMSLVWSGAHDADMTPDTLAAQLNQISQAKLGKIEILTSQDPAVRAFPLLWLKAEQMAAHRLVLIGDAAHCMHPLAGQGLNLGFGDLTALLGVLKNRLSAQDIGDARLLRRYQRERAESVDTMLFVTDRLHELFAQMPAQLNQRVLRGASLLGWQALARSNPVSRQVRKLLTAHALQ